MLIATTMAGEMSSVTASVKDFQSIICNHSIANVLLCYGNSYKYLYFERNKSIFAIIQTLQIEMSILEEGYSIDGFTVQYLIKSNSDVATYKVSGENSEPFFMKVYDLDAMLEPYHYRGTLVPILNVRNGYNGYANYVHDGIFTYKRRKYAYLVTKYHVGHLLSKILYPEHQFNMAFAYNIMFDIVDKLTSNTQQRKLYHNDICPANIIVKQSEKDYEVSIIDTDHAYDNQTDSYPYRTDDLNPFYCAPEVLDGKFTETSDVFSLCVIYYQMLTGRLPWIYGAELGDSKDAIKQKIRAAYFDTPDINPLLISCNEALSDLIAAGLATDYMKRMTLDQMRDQMLESKDVLSGEPVLPSMDMDTILEDQESIGLYPQKERSGHGFADVAGMDSLKDDLSKRVIWVLKDKEKAQKYKITPPNGMLLYGPPGCGKTYFAEKFAEETGFNFMMVKGSDLANEFVHGTQSKIGELFEKAKVNAPTIICFDEFDSFVPSRKSRAAEVRSEEVNEFLVQLNNCHQHGLFVIGTTNMKDLIDPAILRKGRMDLQIEIPAPDAAGREAMFKLHLQGRPLSDDIDTAELARESENYSAADISFIVNEAAMTAALADEEISQKHLLNSIKYNPSSLVDAPVSQRTKIGFSIQ